MASSVRWVKDQPKVKCGQINAEEMSKWIEKDPEIIKHKFPQRKRNTVCVMTSVSTILNVLFGIVLIYLVKTYIKPAKTHHEAVHSKLSDISRSKDDSICVPCQGPLNIDSTVSGVRQNLCCDSNTSLTSLVKLFIEQSKAERDKESLQDNLIIDAPRRENFTVERSGLYMIYFHFNFRVPTNYSKSSFTVKISIIDKLDTAILSQTRELNKPIPYGGYENVVVLESLKLRKGTYFMALEVSDEHTLYSYAGSKGLTVYRI